MAALRMGARQWVHSARRGARIIGRRDALSHIAAAGVSAVVLDLQAGDAVLQARRQRLIEAVHRAERRVAARDGHFERVEDARLRRHVKI